MSKGFSYLSPLILLALVLGLGQALKTKAEYFTIADGQYFHLGDDNTPEWPEAAEEPQAAPLAITFSAPSNQSNSDWVLSLMQRSIDNQWTLSINGTTVAQLDRSGDLATHYYTIPAGTIKRGENQFLLSCDRTTDDITIGEMKVHTKSIVDYFELGRLELSVVNSTDGSPIPCRITIEPETGGAPNIYFAEAEHIAIRPGIIYPKDGKCSVMIPKGKYTIWASRGMEWGVDSKQTKIAMNRTAKVNLIIGHEVNTDGYVAADTHIHTLTHSGHGDSNVEERQLTLAGEGVELAIATDHNHNIDYRPTQAAMGLSEWYTPVVGNEVSTPIGHFNAFPLGSSDKVPKHSDFVSEKPEDWITLIEGIRSKGAQVIILNHPRWPDFNKGPWGKLHLNQLTGERDGKTKFLFDAFELYNSTTPQTKTEELLKDWFALLNHGEHLIAVGSSDSHTVGDMVGQGRTYVQSSSQDPSEIDIDEASSSFVNGHCSTSLGYFIDVLKDGNSVMGDTVDSPNGITSLRVRIAGSSWARPGVLGVFVNGELQQSYDLSDQAPGPWDRTQNITLNLKHDAWVVFSMLGPLPEGAFWQTLMPALGATTNPVWINADGNRSWSSPRTIAENIITNVGIDADEIFQATLKVDAAVAGQVFAIIKEQNMDVFEELGGLKLKHYDTYEAVAE